MPPRLRRQRMRREPETPSRAAATTRLDEPFDQSRCGSESRPCPPVPCNSVIKLEAENTDPLAICQRQLLLCGVPRHAEALSLRPAIRERFFSTCPQPL